MHKRSNGRLSNLCALVLAAAAATSSGCGSSEDGCVSTRSYFEREVWSSFMGSKCTKCHTPDGVAVVGHKSKLVLEPSSYPGFVDVNLSTLQEIAKIQYEGKSQLLLKPLGKMGHGGGAVLEEGSPEYEALSILVERFGESESCTEPSNGALAGVVLLDWPSTLRKASLNLAGRLPQKSESDAVQKGGEAEFDAVLDTLMKEGVFAERLKEIFNDILLTDRLARGTNAVDGLAEEEYPSVTPYKDKENPDRYKVSYALGREPLELISYVVRNDKPFTDIVKGNYTVVNPFSALAYGVKDQITFKNPTDEGEFREVRLKNGAGVAIPHAGVLSTPAFLNRWTTTPTNRSRGRARRIFQFFLATDMLKIAERPIDATQVTAKDNPTLNSDLCTVCHKVIDPVAGGFRGYDENDYERFDPSRKWYDDMAPPGFGGKDMEPSSYGKALPWLGGLIARDRRFAIASVYAVYKGLTGNEPLPYPSDSTSPDFADRLAAWEAQDAFFRKVAEEFQKGGYNLKRIVKAVLKSAYYRAIIAPPMADAATLSGVGTARMLTPEMLNRKIAAVLGVRWRKMYEWEKPHELLLEDYKILYGGIDSGSITARLDTPNGMTAAIAERMANEVACRATAFDFTKQKKARRLFTMIDPGEVPESSGYPVQGAITSIKKNIQYLHELVLGEKLALSDPEIERTYKLFLDTWRELAAAKDTSIPWECSGQRDPNTGVDLPEATQIKEDKNYTIRSWMAVMTYLLSDWRFLYE